jgi:kinesin family protein 5
MNAHSSRSHAIMIVRIEKTVNYSPEKLREIQMNSNLITDKSMTKSNLFLVDLAGSERVKKTRADAMRLEEAKKINFSLLVLGNCIQALSDAKSSHVNYRDSKLTRLLQESLGGNAKTSLIVTISPAYYNVEETVSSLMFGQRAMKVQNKPLINKTVDYQALSIKLQEDLDKLNDEYAKIKIEYEKVCEENAKLKNSVIQVLI